MIDHAILKRGDTIWRWVDPDYFSNIAGNHPGLIYETTYLALIAEYKDEARIEVKKTGEMSQVDWAGHYYHTRKDAIEAAIAWHEERENMFADTAKYWRDQL